MSNLSLSSEDFKDSNVYKALYTQDIEKGIDQIKGAAKEMKAPSVEDTHKDEMKKRELSYKAASTADKAKTYDKLSNDEKRAVRTLLNVQDQSTRDKVTFIIEHFGVSKLGAINILSDATSHMGEKEEKEEVEKSIDIEKGGVGSGRHKVGSSVMFHPHGTKSEPGYAKHEGTITHDYGDGHYDVKNDKNFIAKYHESKLDGKTIDKKESGKPSYESLKRFTGKDYDDYKYGNPKEAANSIMDSHSKLHDKFKEASDKAGSFASPGLENAYKKDLKNIHQGSKESPTKHLEEYNKTTGEDNEYRAGKSASKELINHVSNYHKEFNEHAKKAGSFLEPGVRNAVSKDLEKSEEDYLEKGGEGSRGGKVIGHTKSGKPIYANHLDSSHKNFTPSEHEEAAKVQADSNHHITGTERDEAVTHHNRQADYINGKYSNDKKDTSKISIGNKTFNLTSTKEGEMKYHDGEGTEYHSKPGEKTEDFYKRAKESINSDFKHLQKSIENDLEKAKTILQIGHHNQHGKTKMSDNSWQYIKKSERSMHEQSINNMEKGNLSLGINDFRGTSLEKAMNGMPQITTEVLAKSEENYLEKAEGSRGGHIIGHTKSGKPIYDSANHASHSNFTKTDHGDAASYHLKNASSYSNSASLGTNRAANTERSKKHMEQAEVHMSAMKGQEKNDAAKNIEEKYGKENVDKWHKEGVEDKKAGKQAEHYHSNSAHGEIYRQGHDSVEKSEKDDTKSLVKEHEKLVKVLESPSHEDDKKEAKKQGKELKEYKEELKKAFDSLLEKAEGSRGGKVIGHTKSGKPIYQHSLATSSDFSHEDHSDAINAHMKAAKEHSETYERNNKKALSSGNAENRADEDTEHYRNNAMESKKHANHHSQMAELHSNAMNQKLEQNKKFSQGEALKKAFEDLIEKGGAGSKGGKIIGYTSSGKAIYESHLKPKTKSKVIDHYENFTKQDHLDAQNAHSKVLTDSYKKHGTNSSGRINDTSINEISHRMSENYHKTQAEK